MTAQYRPSQQRRALEANLLGLCAATLLTAPAFLTASSPATAAPITFDLSPPVMGAVTGGIDTITGTFNFDPNGSFGPTLNSADLTVTAPVEPGTYGISGPRRPGPGRN
jgi:hypothetical protein